MGTLSAELHALYRCGNYTFPVAAIAHTEANRAIANAPDEQLQIDGSDFGAALTRFHDQYARLRDHTLNALAVTATNMEETGQALCDIAKYYAYQDEATAAEFDDIAENFDEKLNDDKDSPIYADQPEVPGPVTVDLDDDDKDKED